VNHTNSVRSHFFYYSTHAFSLSVRQEMFRFSEFVFDAVFGVELHRLNETFARSEADLAARNDIIYL